VTAIVWSVLGFASGVLRFSVWLARLALRIDVRRYGDGNPGAANAWKAGGWRLGLAVLALDYFKRAVPVALAHGVDGGAGIGPSAEALAPILGHAFSPFLMFRGGKAITVSFGVWTPLIPPDRTAGARDGADRPILCQSQPCLGSPAGHVGLAGLPAGFCSAAGCC
jgi:glycerol-3-phosphate acyltransferase PlsY